MASQVLQKLAFEEIPEGRKNLKESHENLEKVAEYCEQNYLEAQDKKRAIEETIGYTTQSLASVAFQINKLASNFLQLLGEQQTQLDELESNVHYLSDTVRIHKEKVARREIGLLTTNKSTSRPSGVRNGIIFPETQDRPVKYSRKKIDFSELDGIGHGVKAEESQPRMSKNLRSNSIGSQGSASNMGKPPTPPVSRQYPTIGGPPHHMITPTATPSPPSQYHPGYRQDDQVFHSNQRMPQNASGYGGVGQPLDYNRQSSVSRMNVPPPAPPPLGVAHPMQTPPPDSGLSITLPPTEPPQSYTNELEQDIPPPPPMDMESGPLSPPLPPPPPAAYDDMPGPPPNFTDTAEEDDDWIPKDYLDKEEDDDWIPKDYLDKVIAIYDYAADKEDELSFQENQVIYVIRKNDDGWFEGVLYGMNGLFPGNYVEPCI